MNSFQEFVLLKNLFILKKNLFIFIESQEKNLKIKHFFT